MDKYSISCPVCIDTPSDPRILQCGHTICFKCTTIIYAQGQISCPLCQQLNTCSSANALPKNYALQELIEQLQKENKCSDHPAQILDLICYECNGTPVCGRCLLVGSHKGHQHMEIQEYEVIVDKRARKGKLFANLLEITTQFDNFQETYKKLKTHIESASNMEVQKQALTKMVESKLESVQENELDTYEDALVAVEAELKNFAQQCKADLDQLCSYFPEISNVQGLFTLMNSPATPSPATPAKPPSLSTTLVAIPNFSKLPLKQKTSPFSLCNLWWRLVVYPKGNKVDYLSVYLYLIDEKIQLPGFSCNAEFSLKVVSSKVSSKPSMATHDFTKISKNWGFASLLKLQTLHNPDKEFLVDDTVLVRVVLEILK
eukprot:Phypoly_transcript_10363.p1 GENE.Phypoly_transcript_10363~~Phypoly_transcript_10363.p1  ORF type:complete len:374 (+),score=37.16 Phypoly_transcript_10363:167-1288(+)